MDRGQNTVDGLAAIMVRVKLKQKNEPIEISLLDGGVSSNVWHIRTAGGTEMIAKRPLARLNVEQEWLADQRRSEFETLFLRDMGAFLPDFLPCVLAHDRDSHTLFLEYFPRSAYHNWQEEILGGRIYQSVGVQIGALLSQVHRLFAENAEKRRRYQARDILLGTRIDPYFDAVATRHTGLSPKIAHLRAQILAADRVVIHGDVGPKNILVGPERNILLDAECACIGDAAFDPPFMMAQLLLQAMVVADRGPEIMALCKGFFTSYLNGVTWEDKAQLEHRIRDYLGLFLLARIDGKVPVPYVKDAHMKAQARDFAIDLFNLEEGRITGVLDQWSSKLQHDNMNGLS